jgi:HSP20 family protein
MRDIAKTPKRELGRSIFDDDFGNIFEGFFRPMTSNLAEFEKELRPATDIVERENEYLVTTDLPGIKKEDIQVTLDNGILTISAETKEEKEEKEGENVIRKERRYGKYTRNLSLNHQVDENKVKATYHDGVLELVLPKLEAVKPKKIAVDVH